MKIEGRNRMAQFQVFTDEQISLLNGKLNPGSVKTRKGSGGTTLAYIEGHTAID